MYVALSFMYLIGESYSVMMGIHMSLCLSIFDFLHLDKEFELLLQNNIFKDLSLYVLKFYQYLKKNRACSYDLVNYNIIAYSIESSRMARIILAKDIIRSHINDAKIFKSSPFSELNDNKSTTVIQLILKSLKGQQDLTSLLMSFAHDLAIKRDFLKSIKMYAYIGSFFKSMELINKIMINMMKDRTEASCFIKIYRLYGIRRKHKFPY